MQLGHRLKAADAARSSFWRIPPGGAGAAGAALFSAIDGCHDTDCPDYTKVGFCWGTDSKRLMGRNPPWEGTGTAGAGPIPFIQSLLPLDLVETVNHIRGKG
jgi:hypothetical protein